MDNYQSELVVENQWLEQIISLAKSQLDKAKLRNEDNKSSIILLKQELRENTVHSISGLGSSQNFEDLVELSQYVNPITDKLADYKTTVKKITALERLINSPYFARIDFRYDDDEGFEKIYIGRSSLMKDNAYEIVIYDWRSPVASVFYRFGSGLAFYAAPSGTITGEVLLKRQYEINKSILDYFFDSDMQIMDEFLRKMLSQNTSSKMKTIVETIQKEQDIVIRDMENDLMMVQGVAGSGKTSIALHRAAYLMYQGLTAKLLAQNIIIISPNSLFEQYISNVLPELGEDNIITAVYEELLVEILQVKKLQTRNQFLEQLITNAKYNKIIKSCIEFKTSHQFMIILDRFLYDIQHENIDLPIQKSSELNTIALYKKLFNDIEYFYSLTYDLTLPDCINDILAYTQENLCTSILYYDDATGVAYLKIKINGNDEYKNIKQVVIDEAQDYYPIHYELLNLLFPNAKYTILGDINQTLEKQEDLSLYEQISKILNKKKAILVTMDKSFRCTNEILTYSLKFLEHSNLIKSFNRKGEEPAFHISKSQASHYDMMISEVNECIKKGYNSIGLICKTEKNALQIFNCIKEKFDVKLIKNDIISDMQITGFKGILIMPVYMSKGLEFDAVLICDADKENYNSADDKKLLYIASTRALHRLNLFCFGEGSPLIQ